MLDEFQCVFLILLFRTCVCLARFSFFLLHYDTLSHLLSYVRPARVCMHTCVYVCRLNHHKANETNATKCVSYMDVSSHVHVCYFIFLALFFGILFSSIQYVRAVDTETILVARQCEIHHDIYGINAQKHGFRTFNF